MIGAGDGHHRRVGQRLGDLVHGRSAEGIALARDHQRGWLDPRQKGAEVHRAGDPLVEVLHRVRVDTGGAKCGGHGRHVLT